MEKLVFSVPQGDTKSSCVIADAPTVFRKEVVREDSGHERNHSKCREAAPGEGQALLADHLSFPWSRNSPKGGGAPNTGG